ncbi:MAG: hypothetical protein ROR55_20260 [Devosia sp.]
MEVWSTRYRNAHDQEGEAWITIDKTLVHSMGTLTYLVALYERSSQLQRERDCLDWRDGVQIEAYRAIHDDVKRTLKSEGIIPLWEFNDALSKYINSPLEQILNSDQIIVRALGMFDKRLGKRRLRTMDVSNEHEIVQGFFRIRCAFEGVLPTQSA